MRDHDMVVAACIIAAGMADSDRSPEDVGERAWAIASNIVSRYEDARSAARVDKKRRGR